MKDKEVMVAKELEKLINLYDRVNYLSWISELKGLEIIDTNYGFKVFTHEGFYFKIHKITSPDGYEYYEYTEPWKELKKCGIDTALQIMFNTNGS